MIRLPDHIASRIAAGGTLKPGEIRRLHREFGERVGTLISASMENQNRLVRKLGPPPISDERPAVWLGTRRAAEQSTPHRVAAVRAGWIAGDVRRVIDVCSGIGGDAIAIARRGFELAAIDADPMMTSALEHNLIAATGSSAHRVVTGQVPMVDVAGDVLHVDPDRRDPDCRDGGADRRATDADYFSPTLVDIIAMSKNFRASIIQLAPATRIDPTSFDGVSPSIRVWTSVGREVKTQDWLLGDLTAFEHVTQRDGAVDDASDRIACVIGKAAAYFRGGTGGSCGKAEQIEPGMVMVDPDPAIRAAGLTEAFATAMNLRAIGGPAGFLIGPPDAQIDPPDAGTNQERLDRLAVTGRVIATGSVDDRRVRKMLRSNGVYAETIKVRGLSADPAKLRKRYGDRGKSDRNLEPATLWLSRVGGESNAVLTESNVIV